METAESSLKIAVALFREQQFADALSVAKAALEDDPNNGKLWELQAMALHNMGDAVGALKALETATMLVPLSASGQCVLAKCYSDNDKPDLAKQILHHLLSLDRFPNNLFPLLASGLGALGDAAGALEACRRAAEAEVDDGQPFYAMAHYMQRLHYPPEVVASTLNRAVEIEPDRFEYRYALATAYQQLGRTDEAYHLLRRVVHVESLKTIDCAGCLRRLRAIFESQCDEALSDACLQRLIEVEARS